MQRKSGRDNCAKKKGLISGTEPNALANQPQTVERLVKRLVEESSTVELTPLLALFFLANFASLTRTTAHQHKQAPPVTPVAAQMPPLPFSHTPSEGASLRRITSVANATRPMTWAKNFVATRRRSSTTAREVLRSSAEAHTTQPPATTPGIGTSHREVLSTHIKRMELAKKAAPNTPTRVWLAMSVPRQVARRAGTMKAAPPCTKDLPLLARARQNKSSAMVQERTNRNVPMESKISGSSSVSRLGFSNPMRVWRDCRQNET
jgi:hypothetical protein